MMKHQADLDLVKKILAGDKKALLNFHKTYSRRVFHFLKNKISTVEDAEEIWQDTLLASLEAMRDYSGQASLYTFICAIGKHKAIDYYRRKKIKQVVFSKFPQIKQFKSFLVSPEQKYVANELKEKIAKCFRNLKPKYQRVLELKYIEGLTVSQIAKTTTFSLKSVESTLFRARKAFVSVFSTL